jgi:NitT/TauT family transport system substrate-binding protein
MRRLVLPSICATALFTFGCGRSRSTTGQAGSDTTAPPATGSGASGAAAPVKLTVATIPIVDVAPIYLGKHKGFFTEQNLELTLQVTAGGAEVVPAVVSGQCQIGFANVVTLLLAHAKGLPLKVVAAGNSSTGKPEDFSAIVVPAGSPVTALPQLEGKTVSINQLNNIGGVTVRQAVRRAGGDPDQMKLIEVHFPEVPAALEQHRVDAAWVVEPFLTLARAHGATVLDWNLGATAPNVMIAAYFTTTDYARDNPDVIRRFTTAINKSLSYAADHPEEARAVLVTYTKIDKAIAEKLNLPLWTPNLNRESTKVLADLMITDKLLSTRPDVDRLLP